LIDLEIGLFQEGAIWFVRPLCYNTLNKQTKGKT
jgi:hypothetical protein